MLGNLLHEWKIMCYDHPELGEEGLAVMRRHQSFYQNKGGEQWAYAVMDYKKVLIDAQTKKDYLEMAAKELKELVSTYKIELDSWTL